MQAARPSEVQRGARARVHPKGVAAARGPRPGWGVPCGRPGSGSSWRWFCGKGWGRGSRLPVVARQRGGARRKGAQKEGRARAATAHPQRHRRPPAACVQQRAPCPCVSAVLLQSCWPAPEDQQERQGKGGELEGGVVPQVEPLCPGTGHLARLRRSMQSRGEGQAWATARGSLAHGASPGRGLMHPPAWAQARDSEGSHATGARASAREGKPQAAQYTCSLPLPACRIQQLVWR